MTYMFAFYSRAHTIRNRVKEKWHFSCKKTHEKSHFSSENSNSGHKMAITTDYWQKNEVKNIIDIQWGTELWRTIKPLLCHFFQRADQATIESERRQTS